MVADDNSDSPTADSNYGAGPVYCASCGVASGVDARFCSGCGIRFRSGADAPASEQSGARTGRPPGDELITTEGPRLPEADPTSDNLKSSVGSVPSWVLYQGGDPSPNALTRFGRWYVALPLLGKFYSLLAVLFVGFSAWGLFLEEKSPEPEPARTTVEQGDDGMAWLMCQQFLEDRLVAPATADFPGPYTRFTTSLGRNRFKVDAYVDSENGFGANLRSDFVCTVSYKGNDTWNLESLEVE